MSASGRLWQSVEYVACAIVLVVLGVCWLGQCGCARTLEYCEDGCAGAGAGGQGGSAGSR
ncbi:MAG: hypothetical protein A2Y74_05305 [Actinobacteria bacterium RBG_13_63_9]|nr:MAG: hypothetical protein A2Y74_05305 [Actinobacteria bacterium RBG_13_63_9]